MSGDQSNTFAPYETRNIQFHGIVETEGWKTKTYKLTKKGSFESVDSLAASLTNLNSWLRQSDNYEFDIYNIACLIVHECDEGVFSILNWWTGENMLQNFVYYSANSNPSQFELMSEGGLTCCVWEMAIIWHERNAWIEHVLKKADCPQFDKYLDDIIEGCV